MTDTAADPVDALLDLHREIRRVRVRGARATRRDWDTLNAAFCQLAGEPDTLLAARNSVDPLAALQAALNACSSAGVTIRQVAECRFGSASLALLLDGRD
ncbi:MAG: hypothetical protein GC150_17295 [Rhizobiales bacterium]|nr:hypothetical protein [Hyphomicrobiales bacterium]